MPIKVTWDTEEKHAINMDISGQWTWDDMWHALDDVKVLLDAIDYVACIIIPNSAVLVTTLPPGMLTQVGAFNRHRHPRSGTMLFIDEKGSSGGRLWFRMIGAVYPQFYDRFKFVDSLDQARSIARERYQQQMQHLSKTRSA